DYETSLIIYTKEFVPEFLFPLGQKEGQMLLESQTTEPVNIDENDLKLLDLLQRDARTPVLSLAKKLNTTPYVVRYKIRSLLKSGVINSFKTLINLDLLGYGWYQVLLHTKNLTEKEEANLIEQLKTIKGIDYMVKCMGKWNFQVHVNLSSNLKFRETLLDLKSKLLDYIVSYDTLITFRKYKSKTLPEGAVNEIRQMILKK
ncbi:Lrp/AsnC family transcriptional regulator, partial [Candidatus Woesearchaeota archaeon]|nr:Lrp/AsnC family transcriptional regulator [Candidatus Woesearchaeota archaeon]